MKAVFHKKNSQIIDEILKSISAHLKPDEKEREWFDLTSNDPSIWIKVKIAEYLLYGAHINGKQKLKYETALDSFATVSLLNKVIFLKAICKPEFLIL